MSLSFSFKKHLCVNKPFTICDNRNVHCAGTLSWLGLWSLVVRERNGGGESNICSPVEEMEGGREREREQGALKSQRKEGGREDVAIFFAMW